MLGGGLWFALQPVQRETGRFFFLHPKWAETPDRYDGAVNFAAFGLFAWLTVRMFGGDSRRWVGLPAALLIGIGILFIEYLQGGIPGRSVDMRDVVTGIAGAVAGAMVGAAQASKAEQRGQER
jgi:hypothetical protein